MRARFFEHQNGVFVPLFLIFWAVYFAALCLHGNIFAYENLPLAIAYQGLFAAIVALVLALLPSKQIELRVQTNPRQTAILILVGLGCSALAIASLYFDYVMSGIVYAGICAARGQLVNQAVAGGSVTTPFSIVGHLLASSFFVATGVALTRPVSRRWFFIAIAGSTACLLIYSFVTSSRSSIMLYVCFVAGLSCWRPSLGLAFSRPNWRDAVLAIVLAALCVAYVLAVFDCRAKATGVSADQYATDFAEHLGVPSAPDAPLPTTPSLPNVPAEGEDPDGPAPVPPTGNGILEVALLYGIHSAYTFASVIGSPPEEARVILTYPWSLLARAKLVPPPNENWGYAGRFVSVPGGLYHDFGLVGLIVGAIIIALVTHVCVTLMRVFRHSVLTVGLAGGAGTVLLLSPVHLAADFLAFPFVAVSFLLVPAIAWVVGRIVGADT